MGGTTEAPFPTWMLGAMTLLTAIIGGIVGHIHWRISQQREEYRQDLRQIWDKIDGHGSQFLIIAQNGATKQDIRDLIGEIHQLRVLLESLRHS